MPNWIWLIAGAAIVASAILVIRTPAFRRRLTLVAVPVAALAATYSIVIISGLAALAVGSAKWATSPTFGVWSDYTALIAEMVASSAVAGLAAGFLLTTRRRLEE